MITYLFGAGASRHAIPIVEELRVSMKKEIQNLKEEFKDSEQYIVIDNIQYGRQGLFDSLIQDFTWVVESSKSHQSIDTFAKKLFLQGEFDLFKKLKTILSIYFLLIQTRNKVDIRYDSFFASILKNNHLEFPKNLRILSWNYDYQFEKAYSEYSRDSRFESCQSLLNVYSKNSRYSGFRKDRFGIVKLNGTATLILNSETSNPYNIIDSADMQYSPDNIEVFLKHYAYLHHITKTKEKYLPCLSFAWEDYAIDSPVIQNAIDATNNTEILVVVGYSFPFFNRFVDRNIIQSMKQLQKVYFQAPDADVLKERFLAIRNDLTDQQLIVRKDVGQFVFPNEF